LALRGEHSEALNLLLDVPDWGTPWFQSGIGYLEKRATQYARVAAREQSDLRISDGQLDKLYRIRDAFTKFASVLDMTQLTTVFHAEERLI
jgi:hypothetical protein